MRHFIATEKLIHQEDTKIINAHASYNRASKYISKFVQVKGKTINSIIIDRDSNSFSATGRTR